jgi:hypothetical protein
MTGMISLNAEGISSTLIDCLMTTDKVHDVAIGNEGCELVSFIFDKSTGRI